MAQNKQIGKRVIGDTSIPYRPFIDITSDEPVFTAGQNVLTSAKQIMERRPGFSTAVQTASAVTFSAASREFRWSKWGGTRFFSMASDLQGGVQKVYKLEFGVDTHYIPLFTSAGAAPFDFAVSNNFLFFGNGTEMRWYDGNTTPLSYQWGITRPSVAPTSGTTGTGISSYAGGWYYRYTYYSSTTGHESSASDLSACTGNVSNKTLTIGVTASTDPQVDQIRIYRTTDGGSTNPLQMAQIVGSPFTNATATYNDTTLDASLSATRFSPTTISNDPPPAASKLAVYSGRIFVASNSTMYFSAFEENANGVNEMSFPSGTTGNSRPVDKEISSLRPVQDGVAIYTRSGIWEYQGDRRDNFRLIKLMEIRGATSHINTFALGSTLAWLDTSNQVWMDGNEIGFDIRSDIQSIDQSQSAIAVHISGRQHWLLLLDGANAKIYAYDLDTQKWMPPWVIQGATSASCLSSGETSSGTQSLFVAFNKTTLLRQSTSYNDNGTAYSASGTLNLLQLSPPVNSDVGMALDHVAVETDSHKNSAVEVLLDDDPVTGTYLDLTNYAQDPPFRKQGVNLVKKLYMASPATDLCQRVSARFTWAALDSNFTCYTIELASHGVS